MRRARRLILALLIVVCMVQQAVLPALAAPYAPSEFNPEAFAASAARMKALGLIDDDLGLDGPITNAEFAGVVARAFGQRQTAELASDAVPYPDVAGHPLAGSVAVAKALAEQNGFVLSTSPGAFTPNASITGAGVVAFLMKVMGINPDHGYPYPADFLRGATNAGLIPPEDYNALLVSGSSPATRGLAYYLADLTFSTYRLPTGGTVYTTYVDPAPPTITVDPYPVVTESDKITLTGTVSERSWVFVGDFNNPVTITPDGRWWATVSLDTVGMYNIWVLAVDMAGNSAQPSASVQLTRMPAPTPVQGGTMTVGWSVGPYFNNFNPVTTNDGTAVDLVGLIYEPLWRYDQGARPAPALAESWSWDETGTSLTFTLREGITFQDGTAITADDVVFTYKAMLHPKYTGPKGAGFEQLLGAAEYQAGQLGETAQDFAAGIVTTTPLAGLYAPDSRTVVFKLRQPDATFFQETSVAPLDHSGYAAIPVQNWGTAADPNNLIPNGSGPYVLSEVATGVRYTLEANPKFWAGRPNLDKILFKVVSTEYQVSEMSSGGLDYVQFGTAQYSAMVSAAASGNFRVIEFPSTGSQMIGYNTQRGPTTEKAVRQAISYSISRQAIIDGLLDGHAVGLHTPMHPLLWVDDSSATHYDFDPTRARSLLEGAGWLLGEDGWRYKDGTRLSLTLVYPGFGNQVRIKTAPMIKQYLQDVGIEVTLAPIMDWGQLTDRIFNQHDFGMYMFGFSTGYDPDQTGLWDRASTTPGGYNATGWWTDRSEALLQQGKTTTGLEARREIYRQWAEHWAEEAPAYMLYSVNQLLAATHRIAGIRPAPWDHLPRSEKLWVSNWTPATLAFTDLNGGAPEVGDLISVAVTDKDRDQSGGLDIVTVHLKYGLGAVDLDLTESDGHSGLFTATFEIGGEGLNAPPASRISATYFDMHSGWPETHTLTGWITVEGTDSAPPSLQSATVNGDILTLTFSEAVALSGTVGPSALLVTADGRPVPLGGLQSHSGNQVTIKLSHALLGGERVSLTAVPGRNLFQDGAGNPAPEFRGFPVVNSTPFTGIRGTVTQSRGLLYTAQVGVESTSNVVRVDPDGSFVLRVPAPGTYKLLVHAPGHFRQGLIVNAGPGVTEIGPVELTPGDVDSNGLLGTGDLQDATLLWGSGEPQADLTGDGVVSLTDLAVVALAFDSGRTGPAPAPSPSQEGMPAPARRLHGRLYLPLLWVAAGLGMSVQWDADLQEAHFRYKGSDFVLKPQAPAKRDGAPIPAPYPAAEIIEDRIYISADLFLHLLRPAVNGGDATAVYEWGDGQPFSPPPGYAPRRLGDDLLYQIIASGAVTLEQVAARPGAPSWVIAAASVGKLPPPQSLHIPSP